MRRGTRREEEHVGLESENGAPHPRYEFSYPVNATKLILNVPYVKLTCFNRQDTPPSSSSSCDYPMNLVGSGVGVVIQITSRIIKFPLHQGFGVYPVCFGGQERPRDIGVIQCFSGVRRGPFIRDIVVIQCVLRIRRGMFIWEISVIQCVSGAKRGPFFRGMCCNPMCFEGQGRPLHQGYWCYPVCFGGQGQGFCVVIQRVSGEAPSSGPSSGVFWCECPSLAGFDSHLPHG